MASELFTHWTDYQAAIDRVLPLATACLRIFDPDLALLKTESPERNDILHRLLQTDSRNRLLIVVRSAGLVTTRGPRLMNLLRRYSDQFTLVEAGEAIARLRDSMILADESAGVLRFDVDQPRGKWIIDDPDAMAPYVQRFEEILREGGRPVSATVLGL